MKERVLEDCIDFFKKNHGFKRALGEVMKKYKSLGYLGGTITIDDLSIEEKDALSGFFKENYYSNRVKIRVEDFQKALDSTRFHGLDFFSVLQGYCGKIILSKKEAQGLYESEKSAFFDNILDLIPYTKAYQWLESLLDSKDNGYRIISTRYDQDKLSLREDILFVAKALNNLPLWQDKKVRLAIFASDIAKNPHYFDQGTEGGKLLVYGISYLLKSSYPQNAEETLELLYKAGIIKDEVSNYTICSGLLAYRSNSLHSGWHGFLKEIEPIQVSLYNLSNLDKVSSPKSTVFVFENPTVFTEVFEKTKHLEPSLVCTYGQVKVASLVLLDMLYKEKTLIYYSGDFDPEGLLIADKLKQRYKEQLILWRYDAEDYIAYETQKNIDNSRLNQLSKINSNELKSVAKLILERKGALYQESMVDLLIRDIEGLLSLE